MGLRLAALRAAGAPLLPSAHLKIKDGNNEINVNRVDIEKLVGSASGSNGLNSNKCVLYDNIYI